MVSDRTYIVIKGSNWLYDRLDGIGYKDDYIQLMKRIWLEDKTLDKKLLKQIAGDRK